MGIDPTPDDALLMLPSSVQTDALIALARAVREHQASGDPAAMTRLSEQIQTTIWLHSQPGFTEAQQHSPSKPGGLSHDVDEVFAAARAAR